jgi:hypothetical protein
MVLTAQAILALHIYSVSHSLPLCKRYTPTRVGKTEWGNRSDRRVSGTPPRVWGKLPPVCNNVYHYTVHPHACGENNLGCRASPAPSGTPPRVWGKPEKIREFGGWGRYTPTRVGKTKREATFSSSVAVHPHACGENRCGSARDECGEGTPPRVWGKPFLVSIPARKRRRYTPTRVGKTFPQLLDGGEHFGWYTPTRVGKTPPPSASWRGLADGTPPRVWGKHPGCCGSARNPAALHPHACGENVAHAGRLPRRARRYTPTRVGKTGR